VALSNRQLTECSFSHLIIQILNSHFQFSSICCTPFYSALSHSLGSPELNCSKRFSVIKLRHGPRRNHIHCPQRMSCYCHARIENVFRARWRATSKARTYREHFYCCVFVWMCLLGNWVSWFHSLMLWANSSQYIPPRELQIEQHLIENAGSSHPWNVGNIVHLHTAQQSKDRINTNN
jgi:hypothetical protein